MSIRATTSILAALAAGHGAFGQVIATSEVAKYYGPYNIGSFMEFPGGEVTPSSAAVGGNMLFTLTGDIRLNLDPDEIADTIRDLEIGGVQQFTVGDFPTLISPEIDAHFKAVHAGGPVSSGDPYTLASASFRVHLTGSYIHGSNDFTTLGDIVAEVNAGVFLQGNGFSVVDAEFTDPDAYVLLPGESYTAIWHFGIRSYIEGLAADDPASAFFLEAGGVTNFDGVVFNLNAVTVPTPGTVALGGLACLTIARRRRPVTD